MWYCYPHKKGPSEFKTEDFAAAWTWLENQEDDNASIINFSDRTKYFASETRAPEEPELPRHCCGCVCDGTCE